MIDDWRDNRVPPLIGVKTSYRGKTCLAPTRGVTEDGILVLRQSLGVYVWSVR